MSEHNYASSAKCVTSDAVDISTAAQLPSFVDTFRTVLESKALSQLISFNATGFPRMNANWIEIKRSALVGSHCAGVL